MNYITQVNNFLDRGCTAFSKHVLLSGITSTYRTTGNLSAALAGIFSKRLQNFTDAFFFDPISTKNILFCTKKAELLSAFFAMRKPTQIHPFAEYFDRSFISMTQHLYAYTKRVNDLVSVPENLKNFLRYFSFETVVNQVKMPSYLSWVNRLIIQMKRSTLAVLDCAIKISDLVFRTFFLGIKFGIFSYLKQIVNDARKNLYGRFADIAIRSIKKRERKLRRTLVANIAESAVDYLGERLTTAAVKSGLGLALYIPTKNLLCDTLGASEWAVHILGTALLARILWSSVVQSTLDPYYKDYNPKFKARGVSFLEFCEYFDIQSFYPIIAPIGRLFGVSRSERAALKPN